MQNPKLPKKKQHSPTVIDKTSEGQTNFVIKQESYQGVVPHPDIMQKYKENDPELHQKIVDWTELVLKSDIKHQSRDMTLRFLSHLSNNFSALVAIFMLVYVGYIFMQNGHSEDGASIIKWTVASVAGIFVIRTWWKSITDDKK